jgi:acetyl-CoA synthetase
MDLPVPAWIPDEQFIKKTHIAQWMDEKNCKNFEEFHRWSVEYYSDFLESVTKQLNIIFDKKYSSVIDLSAGVESPNWFLNGKLNIVNSCFQANLDAAAIISQSENGEVSKTSYAELDNLSNHISNSLRQYFKKGDRIAIIMPMTHYAVAIYLGIIKSGCIVVGIPDSFSAGEIATRLRISNAKAVFCQDQIIRDGKSLPLYDRLIEAGSFINIVLSAEKKLCRKLRDQDFSWEDFLVTNEQYKNVSCDPDDYINILFSSGTTGEPKAIPWTQTSPIKCASDAYFHHDLKPGDIFCWPTNLGWMMGPWLIFACLLNQATIALYEGTPNGKQFGEFIQNNKITHLGVVPTMVKTWRNSGCMEGLNWDAIKLFTSTGERSNKDDMLYLMSLANGHPVIEYCGGTEISGAYITGTPVQPAAAGAFTTPALGIDFVIIDEHGSLSNKGEVALVPPSIGLSTELLNKDHHKIYYADMPFINEKILRRHGDQLEHYSNGFYRLLGRTDDTMKLSGIKISSAEIENVLNVLPQVDETAAIGVDPSDGGPSQLIIYVVLKNKHSIDINQLKSDMQNAIKKNLNPLFKIHDLVIIDLLPRTASNKMMRRVLRDKYLKAYTNE